jgi:hypothetical protein
MYSTSTNFLESLAIDDGKTTLRFLHAQMHCDMYVPDTNQMNELQTLIRDIFDHSEDQTVFSMGNAWCSKLRACVVPPVPLQTYSETVECDKNKSTRVQDRMSSFPILHNFQTCTKVQTGWHWYVFPWLVLIVHSVLCLNILFASYINSLSPEVEAHVIIRLWKGLQLNKWPTSLENLRNFTAMYLWTTRTELVVAIIILSVVLIVVWPTHLSKMASVCLQKNAPPWVINCGVFNRKEDWECAQLDDLGFLLVSIRGLRLLRDEQTLVDQMNQQSAYEQHTAHPLKLMLETKLRQSVFKSAGHVVKGTRGFCSRTGTTPQGIGGINNVIHAKLLDIYWSTTPSHYSFCGDSTHTETSAHDSKLSDDSSSSESEASVLEVESLHGSDSSSDDVTNFSDLDKNTRTPFIRSKHCESNNVLPASNNCMLLHKVRNKIVSQLTGHVPRPGSVSSIEWMHLQGKVILEDRNDLVEIPILIVHAGFSEGVGRKVELVNQNVAQCVINDIRKYKKWLKEWGTFMNLDTKDSKKGVENLGLLTSSKRPVVLSERFTPKVILISSTPLGRIHHRKTLQMLEAVGLEKAKITLGGTSTAAWSRKADGEKAHFSNKNQMPCFVETMDQCLPPSMLWKTDAIIFSSGFVDKPPLLMENNPFSLSSLSNVAEREDTHPGISLPQNISPPPFTTTFQLSICTHLTIPRSFLLQPKKIWNMATFFSITVECWNASKRHSF